MNLGIEEETKIMAQKYIYQNYLKEQFQIGE